MTNVTEETHEARKAPALDEMIGALRGAGSLEHAARMLEEARDEGWADETLMDQMSFVGILLDTAAERVVDHLEEYRPLDDDEIAKIPADLREEIDVLLDEELPLLQEHVRRIMARYDAVDERWTALWGELPGGFDERLYTRSRGPALAGQVDEIRSEMSR